MRSILLFISLTYALSWGAWLPILLTGGEIEAGQGWPTHLPGLAGPALAAIVTAVLEGPEARADLLWRCRTLPRGSKVWMVTLSPLLLACIGFLADHISSGHWPELSALGRFSGLPELGVFPVLLILLVVNGFGEEIGWRGFLLPRFQSRLGPLAGSLAVWPIWLVWHLPLFACLADFQAMSPATAIFGWGLGLLAGTLVLANVSHIAGGSVVAAAIWHVLFNLAAGPGSSPLASAVATTGVMVWAVGLVLTAWLGRTMALSVVRR